MLIVLYIINLFIRLDMNEEMESKAQFYGLLRSFTIKVVDRSKREVMSVSRGLRCQWCCFPCCLQKLTIKVPPDDKVTGTIEQEWTFSAPQLRVLNSSGVVVLRIEGPFCPCECCSEMVFTVKSADGSANVGAITKLFDHDKIDTEILSDAGNQ